MVGNNRVSVAPAQSSASPSSSPDLPSACHAPTSSPKPAVAVHHTSQSKIEEKRKTAVHALTNHFKACFCAINIYPHSEPTGMAGIYAERLALSMVTSIRLDRTTNEDVRKEKIDDLIRTQHEADADTKIDCFTRDVGSIFDVVISLICDTELKYPDHISSSYIASVEAMRDYKAAISPRAIAAERS